jgi:hypothetical protein
MRCEVFVILGTKPFTRHVLVDVVSDMDTALELQKQHMKRSKKIYYVVATKKRNVRATRRK